MRHTRWYARGLPTNHRPPLALRAAPEPPRPRGVGVRDERLARLEAVLWLSEEPLAPARLAALAELKNADEARSGVATLRQWYDADDSPYQIEALAGGFQLLCRPKFAGWLMRWRPPSGEARLTPAALETLTVIAYRQPVMRAAVEAVRGVACGDVLTQLMEKGLIRIAGRHDSLGRPVLYGTSRKFLQLLGLNKLSDLPEYETLRQG